MQQNKQTLSIAAAQSVASLLARLKQVHDDVNAFLVTNTNNTYDTVWQALPTAAVNADGTVGTADGTPVLTHPITVPNGMPLLVARNDLLTGLTSLQNFQLFMTGQAVSATANTPRKFADLLNS